MLSIVIPTFNDDASLRYNLERLKATESDDFEVVIVDAGGSEALEYALSSPKFRYVKSRIGRGYQLNQGAKATSGASLLFLHADTLLPVGFCDLVNKALENSSVVGGAFSLSFDTECLALKVVAAGANIRSRLLNLPYGDQALFVRRDVFEKIQGFNDLPFLEDVDFVRRLCREGSLCVLQSKVITSSRRMIGKGIVKNTFINQIIMAGYSLGVPLERLKSLYR